MGRYAHHVEEVAEALSAEYGDFEHYNLKDPLWELIFISCSVMTREPVYRRVFRDFRKRFRTASALRDAPEAYLAKALEPGGLGSVKARGLRRLVEAVEDELGHLQLGRLRAWSDVDLEAFLLRLPGVGRKIARCVMLYAYDREVFPVDTHCWRVGVRLGWVRPTAASSPSSRDMNRYQARLPMQLRRSLHVNLVSHGREVCRARRPLCNQCRLAVPCRHIGV
jgi:endonuclease III